MKEVKRPTKEMQAAIATQLGLEVATVANFFMNARRRSLDKWLDEKDSACHTQGSPGSSATASTSSGASGPSPSASASGANGGGGSKAGREGRQRMNKRAAAEVSAPASPSDSHTIDSPPPQPTRASQQLLQPSGSTSAAAAGALAASFSSDMFGAKMGSVGSTGGFVVPAAAASLGSGMRSAIQSLALFQAGYEPAFGMAGAGVLQPSPDQTLRYKSLDAQYAALQFGVGVGAGAANQNGPLGLGAASSKLMV